LAPGYSLLQSVAIPVIFSLIVYPLSRKIGKNVGWIASLSLVYVAFILFLDWIDVYSSGNFVSESYAWAPTIQLTFGFLADNLSIPVSLIVAIMLSAASFFSIPYMEKRISSLYGESGKSQYGIYFLSFLLVSSGLIGITLSTNLIEIYLFVELVLIPTFIIISLFGYVEKEKVGIIYLVWNQLGAFIFLIGAVLVYIQTGQFGISSLQTSQLGTYAYWAAGLILLGWLIKMAVFGVHMWLPITEAEPPTCFAPVMAAVSGVGTYVIARLLLYGMPEVFRSFSLPLMFWAVITMFYGGAVTLTQKDVKYLFAWSTVGQNAYSLLGLASFSVLGVAGGVFYFVSHILGKFILFSVAGIILTQTGLRDIRSMGGLAARMPLTASLFLTGSLILSAVPPTSGFQAEWILFAGVFYPGSTGLSQYQIVAVLGIVATLLTIAYTLWPMKRIFFGSIPENLIATSEAPFKMTLPLLSISLISIIIGIYPDIVAKQLIAFANSLPIGGIFR